MSTTGGFWQANKAIKGQIIENARYLYGLDCRVITIQKPKSSVHSHQALLIASTEIAPQQAFFDPSKSANDPSSLSRVEDCKRHILAQSGWRSSRNSALEGLLDAVEMAATARVFRDR